ncbi:MAG: histidine phosphatase family protein [bacterium]
MTGRIITARHGRPDLNRDVKITAKEYGDWWQRYDEAGLCPDQSAPQSLRDIASKATHVLSSSLPRAIETAAQVAGADREIPQNALFVEAPLPPPPVPFLKLRPGTWGVISRTFWSLGYAPPGVEGVMGSWQRVAVIADKLIDLSAQGDVLLCAHGFLNWMLDRHLRTKRGWKQVAREDVNNYWSWRAYEPANPAAAPSPESPSKTVIAE